MPAKAVVLVLSLLLSLCTLQYTVIELAVYFAFRFTTEMPSFMS